MSILKTGVSAKPLKRMFTAIGLNNKLLFRIYKVQDNKNIYQFEQMVRELQTEMENIDTNSLSQSEKEVWEVMVSKTRGFLGEIGKSIFSIVGDLNKTNKELKENSGKLLIRAAEQLDKVTQCTQKVADNVMNRIDKISEKQNAVLEHLKEIKKNVTTIGSETIARSLIESTNQIEKEESEIQIEVFGIMNEMQFQDITSQQIQQVLNLIGKVEVNLMEFGQFLAMLNGEKGTKSQGGSNRLDFDPNASFEDREKRQALADEITNKFPK